MTETQKSFFERLNRLETGERAALRREAGTMLQAADGSAMAAFYRCLPFPVEKTQEEKWFAIACLRCLWDAGEESGKPFERILGSSLGELSDSTAHRVENLLDTRWDRDGYMLTKLTRLVKLVRQKTDRQKFDFAALLDDLIYWNSDSQRVQRKWARAIFTNEYIETEKE